MRQSGRSVLVFVLLALAVGACAGRGGVELRGRAVNGLAATHAGVTAVHDGGRTLCAPLVDKPWSCGSPVATAVGLTDAKWQALNAALVRAYNLELKAATILKAWRAGDPLPETLPEYFRVIAEVVAIVRSLNIAPGPSGPGSELLGRATSLSTTADALRSTIGGGQ